RREKLCTSVMMIGMYRRGTRRPHLGLRFVLAICLRFVLVLCLKCPDAGHITQPCSQELLFNLITP
ncbi:MAG: hypothetical protein ACM674_08040, partial [Bacteroidales bacterium]